MKASNTGIYVSALRMAKDIAMRVSNYDHRYKYVIGARTVELCERLLTGIAQGYERRSAESKRRAYEDAADALNALSSELILANELDILSIEHKARIDIQFDNVERQLRAVTSSLNRGCSGAECGHNVTAENSAEKDRGLSLIVGGK